MEQMGLMGMVLRHQERPRRNYLLSSYFALNIKFYHRSHPHLYTLIYIYQYTRGLDVILC